LLTLPFIKQGAGAKSKKFIINYSFRRFFRIYPLYSLYLLLGLITSIALWKIVGLDKPLGYPFVLSLKGFFEHLLLIQGKGVTWTILVEFRYYFVLPILALTYSVILKNKLFPSVALTISLIILSQLIWPQSESKADGYRLGPYLPIFFMGALLAVIFHKWQERKMNENKKALIIVEIIGIFAAITLIFMIPSVSTYILEREIAYTHYHKHYIQFGFLWSVVVFSCTAGIGVLRKFFEISFLRYLGFISFSVYLLHVIVLKVFKRVGLEIPMQGWIMLVVTIVISHISWTLIEKPTSKIRWTKFSGKGH